MLRFILKRTDASECASGMSPEVTYETIDIDHPVLEAALRSGKGRLEVAGVECSKVVPDDKNPETDDGQATN